MKDSILSQISLLNEEEKSRLYLIIERFLNDNEVDIVNEQVKEKVAVAKVWSESIKAQLRGQSITSKDRKRQSRLVNEWLAGNEKLASELDMSGLSDL